MWLPTDMYLPSENEELLGTLTDNTLSIVIYRGKKFTADGYTVEVKAWRHLPDPYTRQWRIGDVCRIVELDPKLKEETHLREGDIVEVVLIDGDIEGRYVGISFEGRIYELNGRVIELVEGYSKY